MSDVDLLLFGSGESQDIKAFEVLRRGIRRTPGIRRTMLFSGLVSLLAASGRLAIPILVQQVIDRGLLGDSGYQPHLVLGLSAAVLAVVILVAILKPLAEIAMIKGAQNALYELRSQAFTHIHELSLAEHSREQKGALLARVTSDVETVSRFVEWGAISWTTNIVVIIGAFIVMSVYSWQLALIALVTILTSVPAIRWLQVRQLRAYVVVRTVIGRLLTVFNEMLTGSDAIRSYGYGSAARERVAEVVEERYRADLRANRYTATMFTVGDFISAVALVVVALAAVRWGQGWGLGTGAVVSFFFLVALVQSPIGEITEVLDDTQTAVAGWDKVLTLLEQEPEISEAADPQSLPDGPLAIEIADLEAGYEGVPVLHRVNLSIPAGTRVAVVGETGSGKTTLARLLCRLMDPTAGKVELGGVDLAMVSSISRHRRVRLVPQDGFLFHTSVAENIRYGRDGSTDDDVRRALADLGLERWASRLSNGLDTDVGPRGEHLSVGERQLVALARAQVADPGLLILDEATSSVDPETEQVLAGALGVVAEGRTMVSIAHRLSTAEEADHVVVFDQGLLVEQGTHHELVAIGGVYSRLHESWKRSTTA